MFKILLSAFLTVFIIEMGFSQCRELALGTLKSLANADFTVMEARILNEGFDLHSSYKEKGIEIRQFRKCWNTTVGDQAIFDQLLLWETTSGNLLLCLLKKEAFETLRDSIVNRNGSTFTATYTPTYHIGTMFRYDFGQRKIDGIDYYTIRIAKK